MITHHFLLVFRFVGVKSDSSDKSGRSKSWRASYWTTTQGPSQALGLEKKGIPRILQHVKQDVEQNVKQNVKQNVTTSKFPKTVTSNMIKCL
jgi:hypothetical protein